ncbi:hypothetical protein LX15_000247 [Streptoalloteichus tenebrarius]|uniref:Uncharacterized protein n=1 Tax=Streptoalloteichus tenebrarius (strain ATCC 17920 / DSM 40477 / JCM 4838 / CBS 697.72 / NBRC 16177 / NCIMB 11028 / NRRL B-12390 / A12253. 1 / ISP 5477) TaxID=1933 RepID=A0ABT1HM20_STRSD|nr:hypothetical protein [Streptoalloteichus tenebrarius]
MIPSWCIELSVDAMFWSSCDVELKVARTPAPAFDAAVAASRRVLPACVIEVFTCPAIVAPTSP